ncbi:hypothetical protein ACXO2S_09045, partial [Lactobacillus delbrueckii subsp. bulgaricus]
KFYYYGFKGHFAVSQDGYVLGYVIHQGIHFSPSKVHARGIIAITSSLIEYLLAKQTIEFSRLHSSFWCGKFKSFSNKCCVWNNIR